MKEWQRVQLGSVASIEKRTVQPDEIDPEIKYIGLENIEPGGALVNVTSAGNAQLTSPKTTFSKECVLFGKLRPYLAKIARPEFSGICSTDIIPITPGENLDRGYLAHFLAQPSTVSLATSRATGANLPRLSPKELLKFEIPLPSINEQRRIAAVLDKVDALRAKRRESIALLDDLIQSVFLDMFGDPVSNDRNWPPVSVGEFVSHFESGKNFAAAESEDPESQFRILKVSSVTSGNFLPKESKPVPAGYNPPESHIVRNGDLLFSRANTELLIGATALVENAPKNLLLPDKLWRFVWHSERKANPLYVRQLFRQSKFRREVSRRASGTSGSMKNISQQKVLSIPCGLPPLELQDQFAERVSAITSLKEAHRTHLAHLDELFASLQQRAFRGDLFSSEAA